jgi:hypothetical protein
MRALYCSSSRYELSRPYLTATDILACLSYAADRSPVRRMMQGRIFYRSKIRHNKYEAIHGVNPMEPTSLLPETIQTEAVTLAQQLGISLSDLYTDAIATHLRKHNRQSILDQLNQVYPEQSSELDPAIAALQYASISDEDWSKTPNPMI